MRPSTRQLKAYGGASTTDGCRTSSGFLKLLAPPIVQPTSGQSEPYGSDIAAQLLEAARVTASIARRRRLSAEEAEDFRSHVQLKLLEDDCAVLRQFQGRSSLRTYLSIVIGRMLLDYRDSTWGKWRPSAEARRAGPTAILLDRLVTRDGHAFDEACEILQTNYQVHETKAELEALVLRLPARVRRRFEGEEALEGLPAPHGAADAVAEARREAATGHVLTVLERVKGELPPQDQLILALRFEDGRKVSEIASMLHVDPKPLYRRLAGLLRVLRAALHREQIDEASVVELFNE
jgi:RNA polymerase sigma factor (sigma-70 family)